MQVLISIGSNINSHANVAKAIRLLAGILEGAAVTPVVSTKPVGGHQYKSDFLNCLVKGNTALAMEELEARLKQIETQMGRTPDSKITGVVLIDVDILQYGEQKYHLKDWRRPYVLELLPLDFTPLTP